MENCMRMTIRGTVVGKAVSNILHFQDVNVAVANPFAQLLEFADAIVASGTSGLIKKWLDCLSTGYVMDSVLFSCASASSPSHLVPGLDFASDTGTVSIGSDHNMPTNLAAGLTWLVDPATRSGRMFVPAQVEAHWNGVGPDATIQGLIDVFAIDFLSNVTVGNSTRTGVVRHTDGFNGGWSFPYSYRITTSYAFQQGRRRYPLV